MVAVIAVSSYPGFAYLSKMPNLVGRASSRGTQDERLAPVKSTRAADNGRIHFAAVIGTEQKLYVVIFELNLRLNAICSSI